MTVPQTVVIRGARAGDAEPLGLLDRAAWSPLHAVLPPPSEPYEPFFDERHRPAEYLVAERAGLLLGYVRVARPTPLDSNGHVRQIQGLAVAGEARGQGVGRALLRAALAKARADGATRITLRVLGHNVPARALYEAEGFVVEGVLPGEFVLAGAPVDDVLMGRSLS
ncbi:GNAT family N-acetyltransferase [Streptomyces omiyaensis]|uniref:GNAT family N-acetyltransferase n=1 Tax=Streptomyces omiyaensis TaxID=68247 RepID=A0ABW7BPA0_9ACTN|nr:GNAT family N-acetyltransferase [Streptomyces omiyaensis]GGY53470.1 N-acetyltransferase [Streptomyces omiyaensis]